MLQYASIFTCLVLVYSSLTSNWLCALRAIHFSACFQACEGKPHEFWLRVTDFRGRKLSDATCRLRACRRDQRRLGDQCDLQPPFFVSGRDTQRCGEAVANASSVARLLSFSNCGCGRRGNCDRSTSQPGQMPLRGPSVVLGLSVIQHC